MTKLSQTTISLFLDCSRCFWQLMNRNIRRPSGFSYLLNIKLDQNVKHHFDFFRMNEAIEPEFFKRDLFLQPLKHPKIREWRNYKYGLQSVHEETGFTIKGAIDDIFVDPDTDIEHIVDIKATAKTMEIDSIEKAPPVFLRQLDLYTWLASRNGRNMGKTAYLYYCNSRSTPNCFKGKLDFEVSILEHRVDLSWIPDTLTAIKETLEYKAPPLASENCEYCRYVDGIQSADIPFAGISM